MTPLTWAIALPTLGAALAALVPQRTPRRALRIIFAIAAAASAGVALPRLDALSAVFVAVISVVAVLVVAYSTSIVPHSDAPEIRWTSKPAYFLLFGIFWSSMLAAVTSPTLIGMWLGISATTLATAFLVGFSGGKSALEAAWKYVMLCSFGIAVALLGIVLLARAAIAAGVPSNSALAWNELAAHLGAMQPELVRVALLSMLLGFAVKAGLVPMHTWLPDAHSKAPAPISAALSGLLVTCALYAIARVQALAHAAHVALFDPLLGGIGIASLLLGTMLMLAQRDPKRLLSYSTIEHSGLVAIALAIGTPLALFAAVFHAVAHAFAKSSAFLAVGISYERGRSSRLELAPFIALGGLPPFATFASEMLILGAAAQARAWVALIAIVIGSIVGFIALARFAVGRRAEASSASAARTPKLALTATLVATAAAVLCAAFPYLGVFRP